MNKRIAQYYTRRVDFALCFIQDENKRGGVSFMKLRDKILS